MENLNLGRVLDTAAIAQNNIIVVNLHCSDGRNRGMRATRHSDMYRETVIRVVTSSDANCKVYAYIIG